jgi:hypothetical protein
VVEADPDNGGLRGRHGPVNSNPGCLHRRRRMVAARWWAPAPQSSRTASHRLGHASATPRGHVDRPSFRLQPTSHERRRRTSGESGGRRPGDGERRARLPRGWSERRLVDLPVLTPEWAGAHGARFWQPSVRRERLRWRMPQLIRVLTPPTRGVNAGQ